jgi:hypothetical protein
MLEIYYVVTTTVLFPWQPMLDELVPTLACEDDSQKPVR